MNVGPSEEYQALLRGEINAKEYVESLKRRVDERLAQERLHRRPRKRRILRKLRP